MMLQRLKLQNFFYSIVLICFIPVSIIGGGDPDMLSAI
jgi:hypothetical protein